MHAKFTIRVSSAKKEPWKLFRTTLKAENIPKNYLNLKNGISGKAQLISLSKMVLYIMLEVEKECYSTPSYPGYGDTTRNKSGGGDCFPRIKGGRYP